MKKINLSPFYYDLSMTHNNYNTSNIVELVALYEEFSITIKEFEENKKIIADLIIQKSESSSMKTEKGLINIKTKVTPKAKEGIVIPQQFIKTKIDEQWLYKFDPTLCTISSTTYLEYRALWKQST